MRRFAKLYASRNVARCVRRLLEPPHRGILDRPVHAFDLAIGPRVIELREAMLDAELCTRQIERVGSEGSPVGQKLLNLGDVPAAIGRLELNPLSVSSV